MKKRNWLRVKERSLDINSYNKHLLTSIMRDSFSILQPFKVILCLYPRMQKTILFRAIVVLCFTASLFWSDVINAQSARKLPELHLKFYPLSLFNGLSTLEFGAEIKTGRIGLTGSYGVNSGLEWQDGSQKTIQGDRYKLGLKYYLKTWVVPYLQSQAFFSIFYFKNESLRERHYSGYNDVKSDSSFTFDRAEVNFLAQGMAIQYGWYKNLTRNKRLMLEVISGLGIRIVDNHYFNVVNQKPSQWIYKEMLANPEIFKNGHVVGLHLAFNVGLCYKL